MYKFGFVVVVIFNVEVVFVFVFSDGTSTDGFSYMHKMQICLN